MAAITVRNIPEATHRALKIRAAKHNRSTEAEVRFIIEAAVSSAPRIRMGDELAALGRELGIKQFDIVREPELLEPAVFE